MESLPLLWDELCAAGFTLSYKRFLFSPDVFPNESIINLCMGRRFSRRKSMRVLIADDSQVVVERLADLLKEIPGIQLVGRANDVPQAIRSIREMKPDAVILDLQMPGGSGLDVLHAIRKTHPLVHVLICTNFPYPQYREECIAAGANFFLDKSAEFEKIPAIFRKLIGHATKTTSATR
jgi:DNA-binding NarL/FixJ family response regulator